MKEEQMLATAHHERVLHGKRTLKNLPAEVSETDDHGNDNT
jgi:hypothetical protein